MKNKLLFKFSYIQSSFQGFICRRSINRKKMTEKKAGKPGILTASP